MNETTHDSAEEAFHEIHLSGKQLVFLFMFTTVVSVVIFLCGVLVGRGVRLERGEAADPAAVAAAPAPAPTDTVASAGPPAAEPPAPAEGELSYKKRLEGEKPPTEQLKPQNAPPQPVPAAAAPPPAPVAPPPAEPQQAKATSGARPGTWVVQVIATRDKPTASALVDRLANKGYSAFLVTPAAGAPPMFKVQVGRFSERREAEEVARRLEKEEQFKPWISR